MRIPISKNGLYSTEWTDEQLIELVEHFQGNTELEVDIRWNGANPVEYRWNAAVSTHNAMSGAKDETFLRALGWAVLGVLTSHLPDEPTPEEQRIYQLEIAVMLSGACLSYHFGDSFPEDCSFEVNLAFAAIDACGKLNVNYPDAQRAIRPLLENNEAKI